MPPRTDDHSLTIANSTRILILRAFLHATHHPDRIQQSKKLFDAAIVAAARAGFLSDAAFTSEHCGILHAEQGDASWAEFYLHTAMERYKLWGAQAKVDQMRRRWRKLFDLDQPSTHCSRLESTVGMFSNTELSTSLSLSLQSERSFRKVDAWSSKNEIDVTAMVDAGDLVLFQTDEYTTQDGFAPVDRSGMQ